MPAHSSARIERLDALRAEIAAIVCPSRRDADALPFGLDVLDGRLEAGGLAVAALHEVAPAGEGLTHDAAATLFIGGVAARFAARSDGTVLWALSRSDLYAPGLEQAGLAPARMLYAEARSDEEVLALAEDGLRHGGLAAVIAEVWRCPVASARRLQLAAGDGRTPLLLLRHWRRRGACPLAEPSPAETRWRIGAAASVPLPYPGVGRPCWTVELARQRGGNPFTTIVESCDAAGCLALPSAPLRRAPARDGEAARAA